MDLIGSELTLGVKYGVRRPNRSTSGLGWQQACAEAFQPDIWSCVEGRLTQNGRDRSPQGGATHPETEGVRVLYVKGGCRV